MAGSILPYFAIVGGMAAGYGIYLICASSGIFDQTLIVPLTKLGLVSLALSDAAHKLGSVCETTMNYFQNHGYLVLGNTIDSCISNYLQAPDKLIGDGVVHSVAVNARLDAIMPIFVFGPAAIISIPLLFM